MVSKIVRESVEKAVLETYRRENPSMYFSGRDRQEFLRRETARVRLYRDLLNFPPKMFNGCELLDFGAGTGEHSVYYANWGATCTLVDNNPTACEHAVNTFNKYTNDRNQHKIVISSLFEYQDNAPATLSKALSGSSRQ